MPIAPIDPLNPTPHVDQSPLISALKLEQSAIVKLVDIKLPDGSIIRICDKYDLEYLGKQYIHINFEISDLKEISSEEAVRPSMELLNPNSMFTKLALSDSLEGSILDLIRIPEDELINNSVVSVLYDRWKIYAIPNINQSITLNLRRLSDFSSDNIPPRKYSPPDFPTINLK